MTNRQLGLRRFQQCEQRLCINFPHDAQTRAINAAYGTLCNNSMADDNAEGWPPIGALREQAPLHLHRVLFLLENL